jgi:serine/threonine-protein kinase HipA
MRDYQAVIWTRAGGAPVKMGNLYVTEEEARFRYTAAFVETGLPGLSLVYPPGVFNETPIVYRRPNAIHPRLAALIPPRGEANFQRKLLLSYLRAQGAAPRTGFDEDWAILMIAGHGGIGHVDVFETDAHAEAWYGRAAPMPLAPIGQTVGNTLRELLAWLDADATALLQALGPTPSVGGAVPKLLLSIPDTGWTGEVALPTRGYQPGRIDVVLKIERSQTYPGLVELEALALDIHKEAGFEVPRYWTGEVAELPALAIERFDRDAQGNPLPLESWFSILSSGARDIVSHYDGSLDRLGKAIDTPAVALVADARAAKQHLYRRLILALLTGNGDLHLENLSVLGAGDTARFSPVYDPTPMRAYSLHNILTAVPFGRYGEPAGAGDTGVRLPDACLNFGHSLGLRRNEMAAILSELMAVTADYTARVQALERLPPEHRQRLAGITAHVRDTLHGLL